MALQYETHNFIDNEFRASSTQEWIDIHDPATQAVVTRAPQSTDEELQAALESCKAAFPAWKTTSLLRKQRIMFQFVELIRKHTKELAHNITLEQGKTLADAEGDVYRGLQVAETACGITTQLIGDVLEVAKDMETRTYKEPLGVVAAICPFNFPAMVPLWCIPLAIITGNTLLLKPSERDPGAAMILARLLKESGLPDGVVNVVHGGAPTVNFILDNPYIKAISFVGSNKVGEYVYQRGIANGKRVQANLGAKNHAILLPDADKKAALNSIAGAAFGAAGQRCMALSTLVVVGGARDWLPELGEIAKNLQVNGGLEPGADLGPMITPRALERASTIIESAEKQGANILVDGRRYKPAKYPNGNFVSDPRRQQTFKRSLANQSQLAPTIITNVQTSMTCYQEEIFGPVLVVLQADSLEAAVELVNKNEYGNGAVVFTSNGTSSQYFQKNIEAGQVGINVPLPVPLPMFSFTGNKRSVAGGGGNYFYGNAGLQFYTQTKTVTSLWRSPTNSTQGPRMSMPTQK
ncbi:unnamed protein product [Clonostachys rhizophaga]|uniref:methylmalonate-semialdehyde dehydrogenase (CoA acylating) n=1 Tax=Clonostachys rhizophaga TaxID=160324 RepID=A0A9N9VC92_9HYPO|nr:unnamed protein product [Clonostachys rhizophaga]